MMKVLSKQFDFAAWNTKLAPPSTKPSQDTNHLNLVKQVFAGLLEHGCKMFAFTEVRRLDVLQWLPEDIRGDWSCIRDDSKRVHDFDLALLYDQRHISELDYE